MKKIKLILFDIDNTLVFGPEAKVFYLQYSIALEKAFARALGLDHKEAKRIVDDHRVKYNGQGERAFVTHSLDMAFWYDAICSLEPKVFLVDLPPVRNLLTQLKVDGYRIGAITDGPTKQAEKILSTIGVDKNIFSLFIGWELGMPLPKGGSKNVYQKVLSEYALLPKEVMMVGDSLGSDILPASEVGLRVVHIGTHGHSVFPTLKSVAQLSDYLKKITNEN